MWSWLLRYYFSIVWKDGRGFIIKKGYLNWATRILHHFISHEGHNRYFSAALTCSYPWHFSRESLRAELPSANVPLLRSAQQNRHRWNIMPAKWPVPRLRSWIVQGKLAKVCFCQHDVRSAFSLAQLKYYVQWVHWHCRSIGTTTFISAYIGGFQPIQILTLAAYVGMLESSSSIFIEIYFLIRQSSRRVLQCGRKIWLEWWSNYLKRQMPVL